MIRKFRVLAAFPIWRRREPPVGSPHEKWNGQAKHDEVFEVELANPKWHEVGYAYYRVDLPRDVAPDFSGARLAYLLKHKYIEEM